MWIYIAKIMVFWAIARVVKMSASSGSAHRENFIDKKCLLGFSEEMEE